MPKHLNGPSKSWQKAPNRSGATLVCCTISSSFTVSMHPSHHHHPHPHHPHPGFKLQTCSWKVRSDTLVQPLHLNFCLLRKMEPTRAPQGLVRSGWEGSTRSNEGTKERITTGENIQQNPRPKFKSKLEIYAIQSTKLLYQFT